MASSVSPPTTSTVISRNVKIRKCIVLIGGMYNMFVATGVAFSINTLYVELLDVFQTTRKETSFVQTTLIGITFAGGLITGFIVRHVGIKISLMTGTLVSFLGFFLGWFAESVPYLIATLGILGGFGNSLINISTIVLITSTFKDKRSLPLSLVMVGSGLGQIIFPLLLERLLDVFGWRGALLITSGLYLNITVSCLLTTSSVGAGLPFRLPKIKGGESENKRVGLLHNILKPKYLIHVLTSGMSLSCVANMSVLFMDFLDSQGQTLQTSVNVFIGYSTTGLLARLGVGALNSRRIAHSHIVYWSSSIFPGCSLLLLKVASNFTSTVALLWIIGAGAGGMVTLMNVVPIDMVGIDNAAIATGITTMVLGILTPVTGVLIGWIFDTTRSYSLAFDVCGYIITGSALINFVVFGVQVFLQKRRKPQQEIKVHEDG